MKQVQCPRCGNVWQEVVGYESGMVLESLRGGEARISVRVTLVTCGQCGYVVGVLPWEPIWKAGQGGTGKGSGV